MRIILPILLLGFQLLGGVTVEQMKQESRFALVIASSISRGSGLSDTNVRSAQKMEAFLRQKGFKVITAYEQDREELIKTYRKFDRQLPSHGVVAVVYSGNIITHQHRSWIVPPALDMDDLSQLKRIALSLDYLVEKLQRHTPRVMLTFVDGYQYTSGTDNTSKRSLLRIFSDIKHVDLFAAYSHGVNPWMLPYVVKQVGGRETSIEALAAKLQQKGVETLIAQKEFYFNVPDKIISPEDAAWQRARTFNSVESYAAFVRAFPTSKYVPLADERVETMQAETKKMQLFLDDANMSAESNMTVETNGTAEKNTTELPKVENIDSNNTSDEPSINKSVE